MFKLTKINVVIATFLTGIPVILFFQNCGQAGSLTTTSKNDVSAKSTTDSFVIVPPSSESHDQIISIHKPPLSIDENNGSGSAAASSDSSESDSAAKGSIAQCGTLIISDILLKVASISMNCDKPNENGFQIIDSDKTISLDKLNLKVRALKSNKIKEIFLLLSVDENKVLSSDNIAMDLKAPSAQQSGIKIKLDKEISVVEGKNYNLELSINPSEQIVTNKNKCLFKPVVHAATISSL
jgi:hypothetical protein